MDPDWQLLPSQFDGTNYGPLDNAFCGHQLAPSNYYMQVLESSITVVGTSNALLVDVCTLD